MANITITNPNIVEFFEKNEIYEPNSFLFVLIKQFIENHKNNEKQSPENTNKNEKVMISKEELKVFYEEYKFFR